MSKIVISRDLAETTVEFLVPSTSFGLGETPEVGVRLSGARSSLELEGVALELETRYRTEDGYREATVERFDLATDFAIRSGLSETRESSISIPYETPITYGSIGVLGKLRTDDGRTIGEEFFDVTPTDRFQAAFDAMTDLGFVPRNVECRVDDSSSDRPFVPEFDFEPTSGPFAGTLDEVELFVRPGPEELTLLFAVDRDGDLNPVPDADASKTVVDGTEGDQLRDQLESVVERNVSG